MKKIIIGMLLVLLTICLCVSCSSSPSSKANDSVTFEAFIEGSEDNDQHISFTVNKDNTGLYVISCGSTILEYPVTISYNPTLSYTAEEGDVSPKFYKDSSSSKPIKSFEELLKLDAIYDQGSLKLTRVEK